MKIGRGFCLLLICVDTIQTTLIESSVLGLGKTEASIRDLPKLKSVTTADAFSSISKPEVENLVLENHNVKAIPTAETGRSSGCLKPIKTRKRSLVLVRRGCVGVVGSGLLKTANGLSKSGEKLKKFDRFFSNLSAAQKLKWIARKTNNGVKRVVFATGRGVRQTLLLFGAGIFLIIKAISWGVTKIFKGGVYTGRQSWKGLKVVGRKTRNAAILIKKFGVNVALGTWEVIGKGLSAAGKGVLKAGDRMQAQTAAKRLKSPNPSVS